MDAAVLMLETILLVLMQMTYGAKSNSTLLGRYGFCIENNVEPDGKLKLRFLDTCLQLFQIVGKVRGTE